MRTQRTPYRLGQAVALLVCFGLLGCEQQSSNHEQMVALGKAVPGKETKPRRVEVTPELVAKGKALFGRCTGCHGKQGQGRIGIGPRINSQSFLAAATDDFLYHTIQRGRAGTTMIAWGEQLAPMEIRALVAYIRSWKNVAPVALDESPVSGDSAKGEKLFADICASCHGRTGAGYQETANGTGILRKAFLSSVSNGFLRYIIEHGKSGTKMRPFATKSAVAVANLNERQIESVIAYLREKAW